MTRNFQTLILLFPRKLDEWHQRNHFLYILAAQNNPFLQDDQQQYTYDAAGMQQQGGQQAYYGGGYTQAQSGYSSSGYGKLFKFS